MADDQPAEVKNPPKTRPGSGKPGPGRPKGSLSKTTLIRHAVGKQLLRDLEAGIPDLKVPPAAERWARLISHRSGQVRYMTEKYLHEALHGKPRVQVDVTAGFRGDPLDNLRRAAEAAASIREERLKMGARVGEVVDVKLIPGNGNGHNGNGHE